MFLVTFCKQTNENVLSSEAVDNEAEYIKIATFNIYRWGQTDNDEKNYEELAKLVGDFDLIAVQEVMPQHGEERVPKLMEKLGENYIYFISPKTGAGTYYERYAFIYKKDIEHKADSRDFIIEGPSNNQFYNRVPYKAYFKAGNFDFWIMNVHLL